MGLVVVYHLFPQALPGGFIGVDIFLVISGYLIIGSLVRGASTTGRIDLVAFYARRIRRLLPASTFVLIAVMAATVAVLPQGRWQDVARDVIASALQFQNWNQAFGSSSYESASTLVSPVQHFWSLAVEEQFYLVIPLLLMLAVAGGRRIRQDARMASLWLLSIVTVATLFHSIVFSERSHDIAYFATTTRIWELALGGIAALVLPSLGLNGRFRSIVGWLGLGMIVIGALRFDTAMAFPGYVALLPVFGTIAIIAAGAPVLAEDPLRSRGWFAVSQYLSLRPVTYLGDISYSLYLWHWPVIVFYIQITEHEPRLVGAVGILGLSLVLATLSYHLVEQRFRFGKQVRQAGGSRYQPVVRSRSAYGLAGILVVVSCVAAVGPWSLVQAKELQLHSLVGSPDYPGAMAFAPVLPAAVPAEVPISPDPAIAMKDVPLTAKDGCGLYDPKRVPDTQCWYGDPEGTKTMVLVGDSHAAQFIDPLALLASRDGWKVRAMVRNGCPFSAAPPSTEKKPFTNCSDQNGVSLKKILAMKPDRVVISGMTPYGYEKALKWGWASAHDLVDGYVDMIQPLADAAINVSVIADVPYPDVSVPDCVAQHGPAAALCQVDARIPKIGDDPLLLAAGRVPGVHVVNINDYLCRENECPPVVGNVLTFRDNHLTATFAKTLASPLESALGLK